jgi:hypothetical protein
MAAFVWTNAEVVINADDVSAYTRSVTLDLGQDAPEDTAMGDTARSYLGGGLKNSSLTLEVNDDFADNALDEIVWDIYSAGTAVACTVKPVKGTAISAANPEFQFNAILTGFSAGGAVGDAARKPIQFVITGNVTRDITP